MAGITTVNPSDLTTNTTITTATKVLIQNGNDINLAALSEVYADTAATLASTVAALVLNVTTSDVTASGAVDNTRLTMITLNQTGSALAVTLDNAPAVGDIILIKVTGITNPTYTHTVALPSGSTWEGSASGQTASFDTDAQYILAFCTVATEFQVIVGNPSSIA